MPKHELSNPVTESRKTMDWIVDFLKEFEDRTGDCATFLEVCENLPEWSPVKILVLDAMFLLLEDQQRIDKMWMRRGDTEVRYRAGYYRDLREINHG